MINLTRPYYLAPVHGEPRHQHLYAEIGMNMGYPDHRIFQMADGLPLELDDTSAKLGHAVPAGRVMVDNSGAEGVTTEILKDRYNIANDGIIMIAIVVDSVKGSLVGPPTIATKGLNARESLMDQANDVLIDHLTALSNDERKDTVRVKHDAQDVVRKFLQKRLGSRPLVTAMVIES
jgi:ribonuclease J